MWLMLNDAFLSIVSKAPAKDGELLVRARRPGDIEKVFGRRTKVTRATDSDYLFRAVIAKDDVALALQREVLRVDYGNFKDSVVDQSLHDAYMRVWGSMAQLQNPPPYSGVRSGSYHNSGGGTWKVEPVDGTKGKQRRGKKK